MTLPEFEGRSSANTIGECIRIREKLNNQFFGKIYRPGQNKTLKNIGLKNNQSLVVQILDEPEVLDEHTIILLLCRRNVDSRTYSDKAEHKFTFS